MKRILVGTMACVCLLAIGCGNKPQTADQAVMSAVKALQDNKPQVLFESLPASYQAEISSVVADAAKNMDKEVWDAGAGVLKQIDNILKNKKDLLLQNKSIRIMKMKIIH